MPQVRVAQRPALLARRGEGHPSPARNHRPPLRFPYWPSGPGAALPPPPAGGPGQNADAANKKRIDKTNRPTKIGTNPQRPHDTATHLQPNHRITKQEPRNRFGNRAVLFI